MSDTTNDKPTGAPVLGLKEIRAAALKKARSLEELLERELLSAQGRLAAVRKTVAYLEGQGSLGACPIPHSDFSHRAASASAAVDALIQAGYDVEEVPG
jgi:hypothetical protein